MSLCQMFFFSCFFFSSDRTPVSAHKFYFHGLASVAFLFSLVCVYLSKCMSCISVHAMNVSGWTGLATL